MRIVTWNINGLRAVLTKANLTLDEFLDDFNDADIICVQETKLTRSEMTEMLACPSNFDAFYAFSRVKKGYSGVATFVRTKTVQTLFGETGDCKFQEGRIVVTVHLQCILVNVYCPACGGDMNRKMEFHTFLTEHLTQVRVKYPTKPMIVVGDLNVIHRPIDVCDEFVPREPTTWLDCLFEDTPLTDAFRHFHPEQEKAYTCWSTLTGARETNYGVRIDYILLDKDLLPHAVDCYLWPEKIGSDHCPVVLDLNFDCMDGQPTNSPSCAKFYPEFSGVQQTLHSFLQDTKPQFESKPVVVQPTLRQQTVASFFMIKSTSIQTTIQSTPSIPLSTESIKQLDEFRDVAQSWKNLLPGKAPPAPLCSGHKLPCLLRTVLKRNENYGRKFYLCSKPEGAPGDPQASCNHFEWIPKQKRKASISMDQTVKKR